MNYFIYTSHRYLISSSWVASDRCIVNSTSLMAGGFRSDVLSALSEGENVPLKQSIVLPAVLLFCFIIILPKNTKYTY